VNIVADHFSIAVY